jgi:hypothetical protein
MPPQKKKKKKKNYAKISEISKNYCRRSLIGVEVRVITSKCIFFWTFVLHIREGFLFLKKNKK